MRWVAAGCLAAALISSACSSSPGRPGSSSTPYVVDYGLQTYSGEANGSANCGDYAIGWHSPKLDSGGSKQHANLSAIAGTKIALDLKGSDDFEQLIAAWCADVDHNGTSELATERFTGGAHCCWVVRVDTLGGKTLLDRDMGNGGGLVPKDLGRGDDLELTGEWDVLAYFAELPFVASPRVPLVFELDGGRYVVATARFPAFVRKSLKGAEKDLRTATADGFEEAIKGMALGVYAHHVLLGDEDEALTKLEGQVPAAVTTWLRKNAPEAKKLVLGQATPGPQ